MSEFIHKLIITPIGSAQRLLNRHVEGLSPEQYLHRAVPGSNCTAWLVGHMTLSDRRALLRLRPDVALPELPAGFEARFSRENNAPAADQFGDVTILLPLFNQARDAMIAEVKQTPLQRLQADLDKPHPLFKTYAEMMQFMGLHVATHVGQISTIRRSLGMPPVI